MGRLSGIDSVLLDLDGTLTTSAGRLPRENRRVRAAMVTLLSTAASYDRPPGSWPVGREEPTPLLSRRIDDRRLKIATDRSRHRRQRCGRFSAAGRYWLA
jgi:hypothetical protein